MDARDIRIDPKEWSHRVLKLCRWRKVETLGALADIEWKSLCREPDIGRTTRAEMRGTLRKHGLDFAGAPQPKPAKTMGARELAGYAHTTADIVEWLRSEANTAVRNGFVGCHGTRMMINHIAGAIERGEFRKVTA